MRDRVCSSWKISYNDFERDLILKNMVVKSTVCVFFFFIIWLSWRAYVCVPVPVPVSVCCAKHGGGSRDYSNVICARRSDASSFRSFRRASSLACDRNVQRTVTFQMASANTEEEEEKALYTIRWSGNGILLFCLHRTRTGLMLSLLALLAIPLPFICTCMQTKDKRNKKANIQHVLS